jgi:hypothetical protein
MIKFCIHKLRLHYNLLPDQPLHFSQYPALYYIFSHEQTTKALKWCIACAVNHDGLTIVVG